MSKIIKNTLVYSLLLISISLTSQNLKKIKEQNVFFILLENKNDKLTTCFCTDKLPFNFKLCLYRFYDENGKEFEYSFRYSEYPDADKMHNDIDKNMLFKIHKSFIRKNKDIIITREFMEKVGLETMLQLLYDDRSNKTIFMINTAETKDGKIVLREVEIDYLAGE